MHERSCLPWCCDEYKYRASFDTRSVVSACQQPDDFKLLQYGYPWPLANRARGRQLHLRIMLAFIIVLVQSEIDNYEPHAPSNTEQLPQQAGIRLIFRATSRPDLPTLRAPLPASPSPATRPDLIRRPRDDGHLLPLPLDLQRAAWYRGDDTNWSLAPGFVSFYVCAARNIKPQQ